MQLKSFLQKHFWLIALTLLGFALIAIVYRVTTVCISQDCYWQLTLAKSWAQGHGHYLYGRPHNIFQPGYSIAVAIFSFVFKDFYLSGKLVNVIFGTLMIPLTYFLWKYLENKKVAVLSAVLLAIQPAALMHRTLTLTDVLLSFFIILSIVSLYYSQKNMRFIMITGFAASAAALTRPEGYAVTAAIILTLFIWNKLYIINNLKTFLKNKYVIIGCLLFLVPLLSWWTRNWILLHEIFTNYYNVKDIQPFGHMGLTWIKTICETMTIPLFILALFGIIWSLKKKSKTYLPIYLAILFYSALHMYFPRGHERFVLGILPLLLGLFSLGFFSIFEFLKNWKPNWNKLIIPITTILIIIIIIFNFNILITKEIPNWSTAETNHVLFKELGEWFDKNTPDNSAILAGDPAVYEFFIKKKVYGYDEANYMANINMQMNPSLKSSIWTFYPYYCKSRGIHYMVARDQMEWYYQYTQHPLADEFKEYKVSVNNEIVTLEPLKLFESKSGTKIYLYKVDW